jgi:pimeloyl-ACP methyl ester carboxylesterase
MRQPASQTAPTGGASATPRAARRALAINLIALILLLLGYGFSFLQVSRYEAGIERQTFTVTGALPVPVIALRPSVRHGDAIAVIVHGYSGSKELMIGFGLELARMGVPSYLPDLPGHGASPVPLAARSSADEIAQLEQALAEVIAYARAHSDVPQPRIILLGHSLGTLVVGTYALSQPNDVIAATILVSPILTTAPTPTHPANLLVIVGQNDIPGIITTSPQLIAAGCGVALDIVTPSYACGAADQGTARRLVVIPGANHITILTDAATFRAMDAWVSATDAIPTVPVESDTRLLWTLLGIACAVLALFPLIALLVRLLLRSDAPAPAPTPAPAASEATPTRALGRSSLWVSLGLFALGVVLSVLLLRGWSAAADALRLPLLRTPLTWVGVALADYSASYSLVLALIVGGLIAALRRRLPLPSFDLAWRQLALGALIFLALYATVGTLATYAWERFLLDVPRLVRGVPLFLAGVPLFLLIEGLFAADRQGHLWRGAFARLGAYLLLCAGLIGAIRLDPALGFLSLLVPIQILLFLAVAALAWQIDRQRRPLSLATALFAALILGWAIAAVFPLVS